MQRSSKVVGEEMITRKENPPVVSFVQNQFDSQFPGRTHERKFDLYRRSTRQAELDYPSPPMSSPPSPPQTTQEPTTSAPSTAEALPTTAVGSVIPSSNVLSLPPPPLPQIFPSSSLPPQQFAGASDAPPFGPTSAGAQGPQFPSFGAFQTGQAALPVTSGLTASSGVVAPPATRTARKSKSHVASACINCKRAHLSCDVQRPCARCVASGKQDTCFDVQHKKRGRPRLREDDGFKVGQMVPGQTGQAIGSAVAGPSTARPIAATRHHRTDSLRSLRSQTSEGASSQSMPTPGFPPPELQSPFTYQQPIPPTALSPVDVPTAYLDLDLVFLRANPPFQQIMSGGQAVRGRPLHEIAAPADNETFLAIRTRLRGEREAREPAYMPPIMQSGQDPLQGVVEGDIDRLSQGFSDHTYTWTRAGPSSGAETFPARVRLAKAVSYFVVVTLPTFRPLAQAPPAVPSPAFAVPQPSAPVGGYSPPRQSTTQSAPPSVYFPLSSTARPSAQPQLAGSQTYPPYPAGAQPRSQYGYPTVQQAPPPTTPRPSTTETPLQILGITPQSTAREIAHPHGAAMQLPPIGASPSTPAGVAGPSTQQPLPSSAAEEEEGSEGDEFRSPKKRRRMDIDDVLQR